MPDGGAIISLRDVSFSYSGKSAAALENISLEIQEGEWISLIGSNGSGKSTLAKIMNALLVPSQGACFVSSLDSSDASSRDAIKQIVSMVFQDPDDQIVASIVEEEVAFGPENLCLPSEEILARVEDALASAGLSEYRTEGVSALSGGQKQRLALAGAIAMRPKVLVLDEALSMLDPEGRHDMLECLKRLNSSGMTIVQITHDLGEALISDRIAMLESGRMVWSGTPKEMFADGCRMESVSEPALLSLCRRLKEDGLLRDDVLPDVKEMLESLCL